MRIPPIESVRRAAIPAALGAGVGLLVSAIGGVRWGALVTTLLGAFLGWWLWLFWGALRSDARIRWLAVPGLLAVAVLIFLLERPNLERAHRFRHDGVPARAVVTGLFPDQHNHIGYRYSVGTTDYEGRDFAPGSARDFKVGDTIAIQYLRTDPRVSISRRRTETLGSVVVASFLGAGWLVSGAVNLHVYGRRPIMALWRRER